MFYINLYKINLNGIIILIVSEQSIDLYENNFLREIPNLIFICIYTMLTLMK